MSTTPVDKAPGLSQRDWDEVHERIQAILAPMADRIRARGLVLDSQGGRTSGRVFFLFTYRDFGWPGEPDLEDVVAGVHFSPSESGVQVRGDIGGGETGYTDYEVQQKQVPATLSAVLAAGCETADQLARQVDIVINALRQRRPPPDYRGIRYGDVLPDESVDTAQD